MSPNAENTAAGPALASALLLAVVLAVVPVLLHGLRGEEAGAASPAAGSVAAAEPDVGDEPEWPPVVWRSARAVGRTNAGRLENGVQLPAEGPNFFTYDAVFDRAPNRGWRRWGTDELLQTILTVVGEFRAAHPDAARVGIADLSRTHGGEFGRRFGGLGHASHQNGLDVDVLYPRRDRRELSPARVSQIDRALAQELVDRFVQAGAVYVFVGPHTRLRGPRRVVQKLVHHDDHLHVRIRPR